MTVLDPNKINYKLIESFDLGKKVFQEMVFGGCYVTLFTCCMSSTRHNLLEESPDFCYNCDSSNKHIKHDREVS